MKQYPLEMHKAQALTVSAALITLWENVPPYPRAPQSSEYVRTGTLGRTLGSSEGGGNAGEPDIFNVKPLGANGYEGKFGTRLEYAQYVIGDTTQAAHLGYWWQMKDIANKSAEKIGRLFNELGEKMARFLEGKGV
jgi:hypothetical protein